MGQATLFGEDVVGVGPRGNVPGAAGAPRVLTARRDQLELRPCDLESLLPADHRARAVWMLVERLDLHAFYEPIKARGSEPGRSATDPKVLLALWLYATSERIGSARQLAELCERHEAYRWLRGGVPVNYHTLSDFRVTHEAALDDLFTQLLAVLEAAGVVTLQRVAQDGTRVRASAGTGSFRRAPRLEQRLAAARAHVVAVKRLADEPDPQRRVRERAAQERAAREQVERVEHALMELDKVQAMRAQQTGGKKSKGEPRASTTDPEARTMRMADGGFRPGYNIQLASDTTGRVIVGVQVTNTNDAGHVEPMLDEIERRTTRTPAEYLLDGGYVEDDTVCAVSARGVTLYAPVPERKTVADPYQPRPGDPAAVAAWRERMGTAAAQRIYQDRAATAELVNGDLKMWRTLERMLVRGARKVLCVALLNALTFNMLRWFAVSGTS